MYSRKGYEEQTLIGWWPARMFACVLTCAALADPSRSLSDVKKHNTNWVALQAAESGNLPDAAPQVVMFEVAAMGAKMRNVNKVRPGFVVVVVRLCECGCGRTLCVWYAMVTASVQVGGERVKELSFFVDSVETPEIRFKQPELVEVCGEAERPVRGRH